jgi:hypothetical protein
MLLLAALAAAAAVVAAVLLANSGSSTTRDSRTTSSVTATRGTTVQAVSIGTLTALPGVLGHPVYWAGPRAGATYELTRSPDGRVYIRYLTGGAKIGSPLPDFLTVGTYVVPNAAAAVRAAANQPGAVAVHVPGGFGFYNNARPTSVYFAFRGSNVQVETYDPSSAVARRLVETGAIKPVR